MQNQIPYKQPEFTADSFNCPLCNAYSNQSWHGIKIINGSFIENLNVCYCSHCKQYSVWFSGKMIYPNFEGIDLPNEDLNKEVKIDYLEASSIFQKSPRGAAALLRLAIQKLCLQLGEKGENLNTDIGNLVKKGLPTKVQQSLDALRVIGNESVHPGQLDLKDDVQTARSLFKLVNFIAEKMITEPKEIDLIYNKIPKGSKKQIEERDKK